MSSWIAAKPAAAPEQGPDSKVHKRDNPLVSDDYAIISPTVPSPSETTSLGGGFNANAEESASTKKATTTVNNLDNSKSIGHPSRLNRQHVKAEVLKKYTTNQPIASFIDVEEGLTEDQKAKMLAERLGSVSEGSGHRITGNSQVELISHVEGLDKELRRFWRNNEKVRSTRVSIQAIKMLCSPKVPQCYPSIFMLVSSVMDTFGDFVAKRLQELSANGNAVVATLLKKGKDADADLIPAEAVEVCNNWFLKISSIRELVPRICVELSLLKCFRYVSKKMRAAMPEVVERLAGQIRGVADPLVASHIRWYLFLRAAEVLSGPEWATPLTECYLDQLQMISSVKLPCNLTLFAPSVQWMLDTLLQYGNKDERKLILETTVERILNLNSAEMSAVLFRSLTFRELEAIGFDNLLGHVASFTDPQERAVALSAFCLAFVDSEVPGATRGAKTAFLSELHGVADLENMPIPQFMMITESLLLICSAHFGPKQIHVMLRLIKEKISDEPVMTIEEALSGMISRLIKHFSPGPLLTSPELVPLVRLVSISARGQIITNLLRAIPFGNEAYSTVALELCRILEQCQAIGSDDKAYTTVVANTLNAVCPSDPEAKLAFLCEARHTLSDAEQLRAALVHIALRSVESLEMATRKRRNIAKVFFAFCHVTIPALQSPFTRLKVALLATAVAFKKGLVSYGEGLLHLCVGILPELEPFTTLTDGTVEANDSATRAIALQILSIAAVVPPHAKYGHLYVFETLLQWTDKYQWPLTSSTKYVIWFAIVRMVTRVLRGELDPRQKFAALSHSTLSASPTSDPQFLEACNDAAITALKRAVFHIERVRADSPQHPILHDVCVEGFETIICFGNPSKCHLAKCAGSYFWKSAKESMSESITGAMERARTYAVSLFSEPAVNEVVYHDYRKDFVFEKFGLRLVSEGSEAAIGASSRSNAYAEDAIPKPAANGPSGPSSSGKAAAVAASAEASAIGFDNNQNKNESEEEKRADEEEADALLDGLEAAEGGASKASEAADDDLLGAAEPAPQGEEEEVDL